MVEVYSVMATYCDDDFDESDTVAIANFATREKAEEFCTFIDTLNDQYKDIRARYELANTMLRSVPKYNTPQDARQAVIEFLNKDVENYNHFKQTNPYFAHCGFSLVCVAPLTVYNDFTGEGFE